MGLRGVWVVGGALLRQPSGALLRRRLERSFACPSAKGGRAGSCRCAYRKELRCPEPRHAFGIFSCRVQAVTDTVSPCAFSLHTSLSRPELGHSQLPSALSRSRPCRRPNLSRSPPQRIHPFHPKQITTLTPPRRSSRAQLRWREGRRAPVNCRVTTGHEVQQPR